MTREQMRQLLRETLGENLPMQNGEIELEKISTLDLFEFIYRLEEDYNILIPVEDIRSVHFLSLESIYQLILKVAGEEERQVS